MNIYLVPKERRSYTRRDSFDRRYKARLNRAHDKNLDNNNNNDNKDAYGDTVIAEQPVRCTAKVGQRQSGLINSAAIVISEIGDLAVRVGANERASERGRLGQTVIHPHSKNIQIHRIARERYSRGPSTH